MRRLIHLPVAALVALAALAGPGAAQTGDPSRGRPVVPDQEGKPPEKPADADSLEPEPAGEVESLPLMDEAGAPVALTRVAPAYPDAAARKGIQGVVLIVARVARDGSVAELRVARSIPELNRPALEAVKGWTFRPTLLKGKPVEQSVAIPIRFLLPPSRSFDWRAARRGALASESAHRPAEAFERSLAAFRAAVADSAPEADSIRSELLRMSAGLPAGSGAGLKVVPVEARIEMARADSLAATARSSAGLASAVAAWRRAADLAPWHAPVYRRAAAVLERAGDPRGAASCLRWFLAADPRSPDRAAVSAELARLEGSGGASR